MDLEQLLGLRRRRDQRPEPRRLTEQLPSRGGTSEVGGDDRPVSKAQSESESAADLFGRLDNEIFTSAITGEPTRADRERFNTAATGAVPRDDVKEFANEITR